MRRSLLSTLLFVLFSVALYAQPSGWQYNLPILIQNPGPEAYNTQLAINVNTQALVNAGQMQPGGDDILFGAPCTGDKLYNFYLDSGMNSTNTRIFVLLDTVKHGDNYIYMFYGNPTATSASTLSTFDGPYHPYDNVPYDYTDNTTAYDVQEGFVFTPNTDILVTELGKYVPSSTTNYITLIDNSQNNIISQVQVSGPGYDFNYEQMPQPIWLYHNGSYSVNEYTQAGDDYFYQGDLTEVNMTSDISVTAFIDYHGANQTPNTIPQANPLINNSNTAFDGYATMTYYKLHTISPQPSYTIGVVNSAGIEGQPKNDTVCLNSTASFSVSSTGTNPTYQWQVKQNNNWINIVPSSVYSGTNSSTLTLTGVTNTFNGKYYRVFVTSGCGSGYSDSAKLTVVNTPPEIPVANLVGPNPACEYINSVYSVSTNVNGGTYAWTLNGNVVSTNDTFNFHPNDGDVLYCTVTVPSNGALGCYTVPIAVTSQMVIATGNNLIPLDSIAANTNNVCEGTAINFRAYSNVQNGTYQWMVNGANVGSNSPTFTYAPANGDMVSNMIYTPSDGCWALTTVNSQSLVTSVTPAIQPLINIYAPAMVTPGQTVTVNADVVNAGSAYYILWYNNGVRFDSTIVPYTTYTKTAATDNIKAQVHGADQDPTACYGVGNSNQITIGWQTGVANVKETPVHIYPNPFHNQISVTGLQAGDRLCFYDIMGKKVTDDWNISGSNIQTITLPNLPAGTYIMHVFDTDGQTKANITVKKL